MTLAARIFVARAQAASRKAARKRRAELERELAGYATGPARCDFEAVLDRYPDGVTHELRSILSHQYMTSQENTVSRHRPQLADSASRSGSAWVRWCRSARRRWSTGRCRRGA